MVPSVHGTTHDSSSHFPRNVSKELPNLCGLSLVDYVYQVRSLQLLSVSCMVFMCHCTTK